MAEEEKDTPTTVVPNPYSTTRFRIILDDIHDRAMAILAVNREREARGNTPWFRQEPTEWIMQMMRRLQTVSRAIMDYKEVRQGFIDIAAYALIAIGYGDQLNEEVQKH